MELSRPRRGGWAHSSMCVFRTPDLDSAIEVPAAEWTDKQVRSSPVLTAQRALVRCPIWRLSKHIVKRGPQQREPEDTEPEWDVIPDSVHGQPGPLAYQLDTLVIRRYIHASRVLPRPWLRLGSLRSICDQLLIKKTGPNIRNIKKAFLQNANVFISRRFPYTPGEGFGRRRSAFKRYAMFFRGDTLPNDAIADAVYVVVTPQYRESLNYMSMRPFDYASLARLSPGALRLYDVLSLELQHAIENGDPTASLLYSEYCACAPQARYLKFKQVQKQMYKLHASLRKWGYIENVILRPKVNWGGPPDWEMVYTPGPKALTDYVKFVAHPARFARGAEERTGHTAAGTAGGEDSRRLQEAAVLLKAVLRARSERKRGGKDLPERPGGDNEYPQIIQDAGRCFGSGNIDPAYLSAWRDSNDLAVAPQS